MINKYYDLALAGDEMVKGHYDKLEVKAGECIQCGHCESRCPFHVKQEQGCRRSAGISVSNCSVSRRNRQQRPGDSGYAQILRTLLFLSIPQS